MYYSALLCQGTKENMNKGQGKRNHIYYRRSWNLCSLLLLGSQLSVGLHLSLQTKWILSSLTWGCYVYVIAKFHNRQNKFQCSIKWRWSLTEDNLKFGVISATISHIFPKYETLQMFQMKLTSNEKHHLNKDHLKYQKLYISAIT